jgi:hypothetical protein
VDERSDGERVGERADAHGAADGPPHGEDCDLEQRAHAAQRVAARGQPHHQTVAGPRTEAGADVEARGDAVADDPRGEETDTRHQARRGGQDGDGGIHDQSDDDHIAQRSEAGPQAEREPGEECERSGADDDPADGQAGDARQPLVEDVPGAEAQIGPDHQRQAGTEGHQTEVQLRHPAGERRVGVPAQPARRCRRAVPGGRPLAALEPNDY